MKKTVKLFAAAALSAAIAFGMAGCDLGTSGFGTITIPGLPEPPVPPPSFSLENLQDNDYWEWVVTDDDTVIIVRYLGPGGHVDIPDALDGLPVVAVARPEIDVLFQNGMLTGTGFQAPAVFPAGILTGVSIPDSVLVIGGGAFSGAFANSVTSVDIPAGVTRIGNSAFANNRLTNVNLPAGLTSIGSTAFVQNQLAGVEIPAGVTSISDGAFFINQLENVDLPAGLRSIGNRAFSVNRLASVDLPAGLTFIGVNAFTDNELASIDIPPGITVLETSVFSHNRLISVVIPSGVTYIGNSAFANNALLESVVIPASVTSIGSGAFGGVAGTISGDGTIFTTNIALVSVTFLGRIPLENIGRPGFNIPTQTHFWTCAFAGNLRTQFEQGGPGTYTRVHPSAHWTRQN